LNVQPFNPGPTVTIAVTTASSGAALSPGNSCLRIVNAGTGLAFFRVGTATSTAAITDTPILPNSMEVFGIPQTATRIDIIGAAATTVYATVGEGQ
jgi:hypothetical protein